MAHHRQMPYGVVGSTVHPLNAGHRGARFMDFPSVETKVVEWEEQMQESDSSEEEARGHGGKGKKARGAPATWASLWSNPPTCLQAGRPALGVWEGL